MSNSDTTVVICCAGMGTRLGIGTTKALLHIGGKPLIIHQLENLDSYNDVRIVVGYQADKVIETVNTYRKDVMFCFNNEYQTTSPSMSRVKGAINSKKYILAIDGDVLIYLRLVRIIVEKDLMRQNSGVMRMAKRLSD